MRIGDIDTYRRPRRLGAGFIRMFSLVTLLAATGATWCNAQDRRSPRADEQACRNAARIVETGRPAKKEALARDIIRECGGAIAGNAAASATVSLRLERDTSLLVEAMAPFWGLQDTAFYRATSEVVHDRSASSEARVMAVRSLIGILHQGSYAVSYSSLASEGEDCTLSQHIGILPPHGTGLAAGAESRVGQLLTAILGNAGEPAKVRSAAACALRVVRQ